MKNFNELDKKQLTMTIFESVMSLFYLAFGIVLIATDFFSAFGDILRISLGVIFILYGIFRIYRSCKKLFF